MPRPSSSRPCAARPSLLQALCIAALIGHLAVALPGTGVALADVVTTRDGLVLEGTATTGPDGTVTVTTADGAVRLPPEAVASVDAGDGPNAALRKDAAALAPGDVEGWFRLALRADAAGGAAASRAAYQAILAMDPDHAAARRALGFERLEGQWMPAEEARRRSGLVRFGGEWMLPIEAEALARAAEAASATARVANASLLKMLRTAATGEAPLARAAEQRLAKADPAELVTASRTLLLDRDPVVRRAACRRLADLADESALRPLILSGVRDRDPDVRREAVLAAASFGHDDTAIPYVRALGSSHPAIVANAARALALLGDPRAIVHIVKRISGHGSSPRVVFESLTKLSYVRDYDVEIAQASNIANPVIGTAVDGMVLDMKVLDASIERTIVETVLVDAFNALAGANAKDAAGVVAWARAHPTTLTDFPKEPETGRKAPPRARSTTPR